MNKYILPVLLALIIALFVFYLGYFSAVFAIYGCSFFHFKLSEITSTLVPIVVAFCVTYYLNNKNNNINKRKEIIIKLIDELLTNISELIECGNKYVEMPDQKNQKDILSLFKSCGYQLSLLFSASKDDRKLPNFSDILKDGFFAYKMALTDGPFKTKLPVYTVEEISNIDSAKITLLSKLYEAKLAMYS